MRIRRGDLVEVTAGDDYSLAAAQNRLPLTGRVLSVSSEKGKVVVEGINRVYKHVRRSQRNPQGGRLSKEMPIDASNVQLLCERCNRGTRVGVRYLDDGAKERFCKRCGQTLGPVAPQRARYAKTKS
jgi:large subunit ribosomal protein L24